MVVIIISLMLLPIYVAASLIKYITLLYVVMVVGLASHYVYVGPTRYFHCLRRIFLQRIWPLPKANEINIKH